MPHIHNLYNFIFPDSKITGPVLTIVLLLLIEPVNYLWPGLVPSPISFYLTLVVYSAFVGGTRSALASCALGWVYTVYFYNAHGDMSLLWAGEDLFKSIQLLIAVILISLLTGRLKEQTIRPYRNALSTSEKALRSKTVALMRSNTDLENFLYMASHDLKSPLHNLDALIEVLKEELPAENMQQVQPVVTQMEKTLQNMRHTLQLLQGHTQANSSKQTVAMCSLDEVMAEIKGSINMLIAESKAQITTDFSVMPQVLFSRMQLHSIMYNLLTNAIKYHDPARKLEINITSHAMHDFCVITITDNGLGMDLKSAGNKLFSMFNRMHRHVEGTGIGLYIVKQIIDNTGGSIEVESEPGKGTTFRVYLRPTRVRSIDSAVAIAV